MQNVVRASLYICTLAVLSACGPNLDSKVTLNPEDSVFNGELNTRARNPEGKLYTGFSPATAVIAMRENVEPTLENKKLAENIVGIDSVVVDTNIDVKITWRDLERPLEFKGRLQERNGKTSAEDMRDISLQKSELSLSVTCDQMECQTLNAYLSSNDGSKLAFIVRNEARTLRAKIPDQQKAGLRTLDPTKRTFIKKAEQGVLVKVKSTEVFPGKSSIQISIPPVDVRSQEGTIRGDLVSTNEGGNAVETTGAFSGLGRGELVGNSNEGELVFRFSQPQINKPTTFFVLEGRDLAKTNVKPKALQDFSGHPLLRQILADKDQPEVTSYVAKYVFSIKPDGHGNNIEKHGRDYPEMKKFVACHQGDTKVCGVDKFRVDRSKSLKKMVEILAKQGLPAAMSMVSMVESELNPEVKSKRGAFGWWQFMPDTAREYGLNVNIAQGVDERRNLEKSTIAAAKMLKGLLVRWKGDLKMSLASYNYGEAGIRKKCRKKTDSKNCEAGSGKVKFAEIQDLLEISNNDFWQLYRRNALPKETQNYVMKFLSGNMMALFPQQYGFADQPMTLN